MLSKGEGLTEDKTTDPLFMKVQDKYYFYQNDHLGTPQKMTAGNGEVVWSVKYNSFGEAEVDPVSTVENNLRFPGQYEDAETGLHYNCFRYYDAELGRYLRIDPIGFAGGDENFYAYVINNPLYWFDPLGLAWRQQRPLDWPGFKGTTRGKLHHDRFLFDDGTTESGYYGDGRVRDDYYASKKVKSQYENVGEYLQDDILREAIKKIKAEWYGSEYDLGGHNCQDYADAVLEEYYRLKAEQEADDILRRADDLLKQLKDLNIDMGLGK